MPLKFYTMFLLPLRCGVPVVRKVQVNLNLLLTPTEIVHSNRKSAGIVLGENKYESEHLEEEGSGTLDLDIDDKVYFPPDSKDLDISTHVRDALHLKIPESTLCTSKCKGFCLGCSSNLNLGPCACAPITKKDSRWNSLAQIKEKLEL